MRPGIGTLKVFPSIWGRKYSLIQLMYPCQANLLQIGLAGLVTVRKMLSGLTTISLNSLKTTSLTRFSL